MISMTSGSHPFSVHDFQPGEASVSRKGEGSLQGCSLAIGNFDGMHKGHQAVLKTAQQKAKSLSVPFGVLVFRPHPRRFFKPDDPPFRLMTDTLQVKSMQAFGVERFYEIPFTSELLNMEPETFIQNILIKHLHLTHVSVGHDFRFGKNRRGDTVFLQSMGQNYGFGVSLITPLSKLSEKENLRDNPFKGRLPDLFSPQNTPFQEDNIYSSSQVRQALREGNIRTANSILGRPWMIEGPVLKGDRRGHKLGFPTANLNPGPVIRPRFGVYAVRARLQGETSWRDGVANFGVRPTVREDLKPRLETHIFDTEGNFYGKNLEIAFVDYLREEQRFDSPDDLKAQIKHDVRKAQQGLLNRPALDPFWKLW